MAIDLSTFQKLRRTLDAKKDEAARAEGAFDTALATLKKEHGVDSIDEAKAKLEKLEKQAEKEEAAFDEAVKQFEKEYPDVLPS